MKTYWRNPLGGLVGHGCVVVETRRDSSSGAVVGWDVGEWVECGGRKVGRRKKRVEG
jgi:hypothetical protein